jgi:hypothetical protein
VVALAAKLIHGRAHFRAYLFFRLRDPLKLLGAELVLFALRLLKLLARALEVVAHAFDAAPKEMHRIESLLRAALVLRRRVDLLADLRQLAGHRVAARALAPGGAAVLIIRRLRLLDSCSGVVFRQSGKRADARERLRAFALPKALQAPLLPLKTDSPTTLK